MTLDFSGISILVIGDIILDSYLRGTTNRISPEAPVPIVLINNERYILGGASNVAANLKQLGCQVHLCGLVGNDYHAQQIFNLIKSEDINVDGVIRAIDHPTIVKTRIISDDQHLVRYDKELSFADVYERKVFEEDLSTIINQNRFDAIIVSDYNKGTIVKSTIDIVRSASKDKIKIIADPKPSNKNLYNGLYCIAPNVQEIINMSSTKDVMMAAKQLKDSLSLTCLIATMSEKGLIFVDDHNDIFQVDAYNIAMKERHHRMDVAGAGDTLIATYTAGIAAGFDHMKSLVMANMAAAIVVNKLGTATCSLKELEREVINLDKEIQKIKKI